MDRAGAIVGTGKVKRSDGYVKSVVENFMYRWAAGLLER
jgi:hypothetical protein